MIGWREWVALPDLGIDAVKAKIDTGARTSSLHAFDVEQVERDGAAWVRFKVHPVQRDSARAVSCQAPLVGYRYVRSSTGHQTLRPVIETRVRLMRRTWPIEVTLAGRDAMGFRLLLGRRSVRRGFTVDPRRSFYGGEPGPDGRRPQGRLAKDAGRSEARSPSDDPSMPARRASKNAAPK